MADYLFRLACLCLASYFLVYLALSLLIHFAAAASIRGASRCRAHFAAQLLLAIRLLPPTASAVAVAALCLPSYLRFEPAGTNESVGWICLVAAALGAILITTSLSRGARAVAQTHAAGPRISVLDDDAPVLALIGLIRPRIVISRGVLKALPSSELRVALRHEQAHRASRDNLKRLLILMSPMPLLNGHALEQAWARTAEWAADDRAVAGHPQRSIALASALVRTARLGSSPKLSPLATALLANRSDLAARVDRLLHRSPPPTKIHPLMTIAIASAATAAALLFLNPATLQTVHRLLEALID